MAEIKHRVEVIDRVILPKNAALSLSGYRETDIELCYLQLRKCLELVIYGAILAYSDSGYALQRKLVSQEWNATRILKHLSQHNKDFYPKGYNRPIAITDGKFEFGEAAENSLSETEFCFLYDRVCGSVLHASRQARSPDQNRLDVEQALLWRNKLVNLLDHHWIYLNEKLAFGTQMFFGSDRDIIVGLFTEVPIARGA